MLSYIIRRLLIMIPTLLVISTLVFVIIELPPGDYLESYVAELQSMGETVDEQHIAYLREQYGFGAPASERYFQWLTGILQGDFGYSFEYRLPVSEVVGDRLFLTVLVSVATILFTWLIAFPIGIYSATHQYSWGDYGLTFLGLLGLATPNFLLALILLYFANVVWGTSIGGLMDPQYLDQPWSVDKTLSVLEHLWIPGRRDRHLWNGRDDSQFARQSAGRVAECNTLSPHGQKACRQFVPWSNIRFGHR